MSDTQILNRWRLILGRQARNQLPFGEGEALENGISCFDLEDALAFLYSREYVRMCAGKAGPRPAV